MELNFLYMLFVFLPSIGGGMIQAVSGFGSGIFVMMFFPLFLPILSSSAISSVMGLFPCLTMAWRYRKYAKPSIFILPAIFYFLASYFALKFAVGADFTKLKAFFGLFLIAVSLYFIFFSKKLHIRPNFLSAFICGGISGVASGLFGIGGPPMVIYMLAATDNSKEAYIANTQFFFCLTTLYTSTLRAINGILTVDLIPLIIPGIIGMMLGKTFGLKIVDRINIEQMKLIIYIFLGLSGLLNFLTNI